ncbi:Panacea domain-containing protein, partial [Neotabrizicola sp. VNH66]|uniref:Panacea domain-containing protein n=1 Tax=Neotabrizicola sp. VNH66 TaxID=3400918 RepID=UPI003C004F74
MTYDARQVANWFVTSAQREGRTLSIMSLLKLTYIAHGWHLETQNEPLFGNRIEAWQYGPVIPDVYNDFRRQGVAVTGTVNTVPKCAFDPVDESLLDQVWNICMRRLCPIDFARVLSRPQPSEGGLKLEERADAGWWRRICRSLR